MSHELIDETNYSLVYKSKNAQKEGIIIKVLRQSSDRHHQIFENEYKILREFQTISEKDPSFDFFVPLLAYNSHPYPTITLKQGWTDLLTYYSVISTLSRRKKSYAVAFHMKQLLHQLLKMHEAGFVHNDVKPENVVIMFNTENDYQKQQQSEPDNFYKHKLKFIDFGFSLKIKKEHEGKDVNGGRENADDKCWLDGFEFGTLCFMHPTIKKKTPVCCKTSDYFALGLVAFSLYTDMNIFLKPKNEQHCAETHERFCNGSWMGIYSLKHLHDDPLFHLWVQFVSLLCRPDSAKIASTTILHHDFINSILEN